MNNTKVEPPDLRESLERLDAVFAEPRPAGWSRRCWVQREALAFGALAVDISVPRREPGAE